MEAREKILTATIALLETKDPSEVTIREISREAGTALGLVNYYFGNREALIEECVQHIVHGIVSKFEIIRERTEGLAASEKLITLGDLTFSFLFEHEAIARISILSDMRAPAAGDNTHRTAAAFRPLIAACRPELGPAALEVLTLALISSMQASFMRSGVLAESGIDLHDAIQRHDYHCSMLRALGIIPVEKEAT